MTRDLQTPPSSSRRADQPPSPIPRRWRWIGLGAWLGIVLVLTLTPAPSDAVVVDEISSLCLICGDRGTADALLNVALFMPLGFFLGAPPRGALLALAAGALVSGSIEGAQLFLPGRHATLGDVVWNGAGAALGAALLTSRWGLLAAAGSVRAGRAAAVIVGTVILLAGWLLGPTQTGAPYYGQWTADLGFMPHYRGTVLTATLDNIPLPNGRLPEQARARERLERDWFLSVRMAKGPPPPAVSPIVSIFDAEQAEILVLGADDEEVVLRERTRAKAIRLDHPDLRLENGLRPIEVGETVTLGARRRGFDRCLSVADVETCGLGHTVGRTWSLLLYLERVSERARLVLDAFWMFVLLLPVGLYSTSWRMALGNGLVVSLLIAVAVLTTRLLAPPWWECLFAIFGLVVGLTMRRRLPGGRVTGASTAGDMC